MFVKSLFSIVAFILLFGFVSQVLAAPVPPPSDKITFDEYRDLIKLKVSEVPDLKVLWDWKKENDLKHFYFGGGALRGLFVWIHTQLATHMLDEVRNIKPPNVDGLLIQKDSDRDIYAPDNYKERILKWQPYQNWDVLTETFYQHTIKNGGSTLDKIRANPNWVEDPLSGLEDLYHGKIDIKTDTPPFTDLKGSPIVGDSWLGLGLRYLRFTQDLKSIVDPNPESLERIKILAAEKANLIPQNTDFDEKWPSGDANRWTAFRIRKALNKLYKGTKRNPVDFYTLLKSLGLLDVLSDRYYNVTSQTDDEVASFLKSASKDNFTFADLWRVCQMQSHGVTSALRFHNLLLTLAQTKEEKVIAIRPFRRTMSDAYKKEAAAVFSKHIMAQSIQELVMPIEQLKELTLALNSVDPIMKLKKALLPYAQTIQDAAAILNPYYDKPSNQYAAEIKALSKASLPFLLSLVKTVEDVFELERIINEVETSVSLKTQFLRNRTLTASEMLKILGSAYEKPSAGMISAIQKLHVENLRRFTKLNPSFSELVAYRNNLMHGADRQVLYAGYLQAAKSQHEFITLLTRIFNENEFLTIDSKDAFFKNQDVLNKMKDLDMATPEYNRLRSKFGLIMISDLDSPVKASLVRIRYQFSRSCISFYTP
ncbi:MAG: hypothetical protein JNM24_11775 [Bdellovibrionaceae bacterium]|nr:hypothetical protein [Pseudobdellovibrionaceae bacterium]